MEQAGIHFCISPKTMPDMLVCGHVVRPVYRLISPAAAWRADLLSLELGLLSMSFPLLFKIVKGRLLWLILALQFLSNSSWSKFLCFLNHPFISKIEGAAAHIELKECNRTVHALLGHPDRVRTQYMADTFFFWWLKFFLTSREKLQIFLKLCRNTKKKI